jgi:hypothetical protein
MTKQRRYMKAGHMGGGNQSNVEHGYHIGKRQAARFVKKTPTDGIKPEKILQVILAAILAVFSISKCAGL